VFGPCGLEKGKYTNQSITVPVHLVFIWEGDKVVREYRFFDPTTLYAEVAASQKIIKLPR
jgi:hypothetical protein